MNSNPAVSVIIPVYNGGANFRRCLASITAVLPAPLELIVVADGPSDGAWRLAEERGITVIVLPESRRTGPSKKPWRFGGNGRHPAVPRCGRCRPRPLDRAVPRGVRRAARYGRRVRLL